MHEALIEVLRLYVGSLIQMENKKKILILGIMIAILILLAAIFFTYKMAYKRGAQDQFDVLIFSLAQSAVNCQPISIQLNEGTIQLVNPLCYQNQTGG